MTTKTMSMKLLIDRKTNQLLFAEAGKDVVDFLFSLLALPLGTITNLLKKENMPGSVGCLHKSIEELNFDYFQSGEPETKNVLLNASTAISRVKSSFLFAASKPVVSSAKFYQCSISKCRESYAYFTEVYRAKCMADGCSGEMTKEIHFRSNLSSGNEGLVKDMVTYTITDDLNVEPMSTLSNIKMLDKLKIEDLPTIEERAVKIGLEEGLKMVRALLQSKTVLTDVFLEVEVKAEPDTLEDHPAPPQVSARQVEVKAERDTLEDYPAPPQGNARPKRITKVPSRYLD